MENKLQIIVKESGIEQTKGKYLLDKFTDYFNIADEWEKKAKTLVVTNENQQTEMQMARTGRLFLREKRIAIEKARKELKEQALREGKAIDGIANVLKALIIPIEEYLGNQENFVKIQAEKKTETLRIEIERKFAEAEEKRIADEKAEQERIRKENERLKKEAEAREKVLAEERRINDEILAKERAKADEERKANIEKARKAQEEHDRKLADAKAKAEAEKKEADEKAAKERAIAEEKRKKEREAEQKKIDAERKEKERLAELLKNQVECPKCHHKFQPNKKGIANE